MDFRDVFRLPARLWVIGLIISSYYICIFAFVAIAKSFFQAKWHGNDAIAGGKFWEANLRASTIYFLSMIFTIFVGAFVDKIGRRAKLAFGTCVLSIPAFLLFQYGFSPWIRLFTVFYTNIPINTRRIPYVFRMYDNRSSPGTIVPFPESQCSIFPR